MKQFFLASIVSCLGWAAHAQTAASAGKYSQANYIVGVNVSQWMVGQYQMEVERVLPGKQVTFLAQVFGGYLDQGYINNTTGTAPRNVFNSSSHWGLGLGMRIYESLEAMRLFIHMGLHYRELTVRYDTQQWVNQTVDGLPVTRYLYQEVTDRWVGPGAEVLFGGQVYLGRFVLEPALGLVFRNASPTGTFHGRQWMGSNQFFLNTDAFNPMAQLKVGWVL